MYYVQEKLQFLMFRDAQVCAKDGQKSDVFLVQFGADQLYLILTNATAKGNIINT